MEPITVLGETWRVVGLLLRAWAWLATEADDLASGCDAWSRPWLSVSVWTRHRQCDARAA